MTDDMIELGRRAVAAKRWAWRPGMRAMHGCAMSGQRVLAVDTWTDGDVRYGNELAAAITGGLLDGMVHRPVTARFAARSGEAKSLNCAVDPVEWTDDDVSGRWPALSEVGAADCYPDLSDPATLGCVLALVREAWGEDCAYACVVGVHGDGSPKWAVRDIRHGAFAGFQTEAAALVAALESAP